MNIPWTVARSIGADIAHFTVVVSFLDAFRKLRRAGVGIRQFFLQRFFWTGKYEDPAAHGTVGIDLKNTEGIGNEAFFAYKSGLS